MELHIKNFRCHSDLHLTFNKGLTLVSGKSGVGKSTIFNAISWCLYGKLREIKNISNPKPVSVTLTMNGLRIQRKTNPNKLSLVVDNEEFVDKSAQGIIDRKFGSMDFWDMSSYLQQKSKPCFISCSSRKKWEILNEIAFSDENPSVYIGKIEAELKQESIKLDTALNDLEKKDYVLQSISKEYKNVGKSLSSEKLDRLEQKLKRLTNKIPSMKLKLKKQNKNCGILVEINNQLNDVNERIKRFPSETELREEENLLNLEIKQYEQKLQEWTTNEANKRRMENIVDSFYIDFPVDSFRRYSQKEISDAEFKKRTIENSKNVLSRLSNEVKYNKESINLAIDSLSNELLDLNNVLEEHKKFDERLAIERKVKNIEPIQFFSDKQVEEQRTKVYLIELPAFSCPSCGVHLRNNGENLIVDDLHKEDSDIVDEKRKLNKMEYSLKYWNKYQDLKLKLTKLNATKPRISKSFATNRIKQINKDIDKLESIKVLSLDVDPYLMMKCNKLIDKVDSLFSISVIDIQKPKAISNKAKDLSLIKSQIDEIKQCSSLKQSLERRKSKINSVDNDLEEKINKAERLVDTIKSKIDKSEKAKKIEMLEKSFNKQKQKTDILTENVKALHSMLKKAKNIRTRTLNNLTFSISNEVNEMCKKLFSEPISVSLKLKKKLKSKKNVSRNEVNIVINYRGMEYCSINQLSGGESDRLSLAFQVAMCNVVSSKILLLDEVIPSMSEDIRSRCRKFLISRTKKIVALYVGHNEVKGSFPNVISLE